MIADRFAPARAVADAVLYEGYVLYPYRASSSKNVSRWQFGVLAPRPYVDAGGPEISELRAECVAEGPPASMALSVRARFLHVEERRVERAAGDRFVPVSSLEADGALHTSFDEGIEGEVDLGPLQPSPEVRHDFSLEAASTAEAVGDGRVVRARERIDGRVRVRFADAGGGYTRISVSLENLTGWAGPAPTRDDVVRRSLVGAHLLLALDGARFLSLLDPPAAARDAVASCASAGCFPVLASEEGGSSDLVLASPIILYDHPAVAPESPGDLFDATEIDEILTLRTLALTDEEKREARATDPRAAAIVDRVDHLPPEIFERLHGAVRSLRPAGTPGVEGPAGEATVRVGPHLVGAGTRVRLRPRPHTDAQDMFLAGKLARVTGVFHDFDGEVHVAVTVDDDPGAEIDAWYGRYRYFHPDEVEVAEDPA